MFIGYVPSRELTYPTCKKESHRLKSAKRRGYVSYPSCTFSIVFPESPLFPQKFHYIVLIITYQDDRLKSVGFPRHFGRSAFSARTQDLEKCSKSGGSNGKETLMRDTALSSLTWLVFAPEGWAPSSPWLQEWRNFLDPPPNGGGFFFCHVSFFFGGEVTSRKRVHILTMKGIQYLQKGLWEGKYYLPGPGRDVDWHCTTAHCEEYSHAASYKHMKFLYHHPAQLPT